MDKRALTNLALLEAGDVEGLLAHHRARFGTSVMTAPDQPAVVIPAAPPAPPAAPVRVDLSDPAVIAAIEAARTQEKDKLYETIERERAERVKLQERMSAFDTDLATRTQAQEAAEKAAADAAEEKRVAELSFAERLAEFERNQGAKLDGLQQQLAQRDTLLAKERQFNELMEYRRGALDTEFGQQILPELRDLVTGNTAEEIDASVSALAQRSAAILDQVTQATQGARQSARGVGVTAPPVGPLDNNSGHETLSLQDLQAMDMTQYAQYRGRLLGGAASQPRDRGMFG